VLPRKQPGVGDVVRGSVVSVSESRQDMAAVVAQACYQLNVAIAATQANIVSTRTANTLAAMNASSPRPSSMFPLTRPTRPRSSIPSRVLSSRDCTARNALVASVRLGGYSWTPLLCWRVSECNSRFCALEAAEGICETAAESSRPVDSSCAWPNGA